MSKIFNISILTPEKTIYKGEVTSLVAPGEFGFLGVLANHAPLVSNLVSGKITLREKDKSAPVVILSGGKGFLEVLKNKATMLLDSVE